jgi:CheY-like chemotaxis protein
MEARKKVNLLLIEDDYEDIEIFNEILARLSSEVILTTIEDGLTALKMLREGECTPDYIFLDLNLPAMSGLEFLQKIRDEPLIRHIPVLVHSSYNEKEVIGQCKNFGAKKFIAKSSDASDLIESIKQCLK